MKKGIRLSPLWLIVALLSAFFLIGAWYVPSKEKESLNARIARAQQQKRASEERLKPLKEYGPENLEKARARAATFRNLLLSASAEKTMVDAMRQNWKVSEETETNNVEYTCRLFTLSKIGTYIGEWPDVLKNVQSFSKQGGVRIRSLQIQSLPDETRPVFSRIELKVEIFTRAEAFNTNAPTT